MKHVDLLPGISPSVLGFGCAPILGSVDRETSRRALDKAWELGVNYFDVAPSYGYGEAEPFLGNFLRGKRSDAYIATKFGIEALPAARLLRPLKSAVRVLRNARNSTAADRTADSSGGGVASKLLRRVPINSATLERSLEQSLRRLNTDYVDILLIHEPQDVVAEIDDILGLADTLKKAGKIRAFGIAAPFADLQQLHSRTAFLLDIVQVGVPTSTQELAELESQRAHKSNVLYGVIKARRAISDQESPVPDAIKQLSIRFPTSVLLCSMFNERHIEGNCKVFSVA